VTFETVYTTAELEEETEALLIAAPFSGFTSSSFRALSVNEGSLILRKAKYRLRHFPVSSCYLKVWLRKKITPVDGGSEITYENLPPYTWEPSGNPCIPNSSYAPFSVENTIDSEYEDLPPPDENATVTVEIWKWSFLPDYEPKEGEPNGLPPTL
jgi:hypothetical protein